MARLFTVILLVISGNTRMTGISCIPFVFGSEGRTVQGILGRNVSLSWTLNNTKRDSFSISRNSTDILMVWPLKNLVVLHVEDERLQVYVENSTYETLTITVRISSIRDKDAGIYKLERRWDSEDSNDSVILQIDQTTRPWITMTPHLILDSSIELQCNSLNISAGNVAWRLNGSLIESHGRYSQHSTFLSIQNVTAADKYNVYTCYQSGGGSESDTYRINIPVATDPSLPKDDAGQTMALHWMGPMISSAVLLLIGFCIVAFLCRIYASREIVVSTDTSGKTQMLEFPTIQRISSSLQSISDQTTNLMKQVRIAIPIEAVSTSLCTMERSQLNHLNRGDSEKNKPSYENDSLTCKTRAASNGSRLVRLCRRVKKDRIVVNYDDDTGACSQTIKKSPRVNLLPELKKGMCSVIDEVAVSDVHDGAKDNVIEENYHELRMSTDESHYHFEVSMKSCQYETPDVHETDQVYITPVSDIPSPFEICQDENVNVHVIEDNYITPT